MNQPPQPPEDGPVPRPWRRRGILAAVVALFLLLVGLQTALVAREQNNAREAREWVEHSYIVMQSLADMERAVNEAKEGELGYLLTGKKGCLELYNEETTKRKALRHAALGYSQYSVMEIFRQLREETKDNPDQQKDLVRLEPLLQTELKFLEGQVKAKAEGDALPGLIHTEDFDKRASLAMIEDTLADMMAREKSLLARRSLEYQANDASFVRYMASAAVVTYGSLFLAIIGAMVAANRARFSRDQISYFVKHLPAAIAVCDRDMRYVMVSDRWYTDFRIKEPSIIGKSHYDVFHAMPLRWRGILTACLQTGAPSSDEDKVELKGKPFWLRWDVRPWRRQNGDIGGLIMATEIVTARKEAEEAMKAAKELADAANRAKTEFLASMNHELRTPLTSIRGALGLIDGGALGPVPERVADMVKRAYSNSERLSRLINDILDLEKIEAGKMQINISPVPVAESLRQVIDANQTYAQKFGVRFVLQSAADGIEVMADPDRLQQVMANLLSNAAKFSPRGGTVEVRAVLRKGRVRYEVEDHGIGIAPEFRTRIFEKFSQAEATDDRRREGTGLGLSIARQLVEEMGGTMGFDTEEGKGTTFYFDLPGYRAGAAREAKARAPAVPGGSILICEDEKGTSEYIRFLLTRAGFTADVARSGREALEKIRAGNYRAVTLDLALADGSSGAEFLTKLRGDPATRELPVVIVSARADDAKQAMSGGALNVADWLVKPFDADRIVQAVREAATGSRMPVIVHVEDDRDLSAFIEEALRGKAEVLAAYTVREAKDMLKTRAVDLVILDIGMPDASGLELLELLPRLPKAPPVLILSASETTAEVQKRVAAALVKSRISEDKVIETILSLIGPAAAKGTKPKSA